MDYLILAAIGILMGFFGGLLGIGGSVVMIPALVLAFGENQHLYQAAAMICNFFVGVSAVTVHKKAAVLTPDILKWLIPSAVLGVIAGVAISNSSIFAGANSYLLARIFGGFMVYMIIYNCWKLKQGRIENEESIFMNSSFLHSRVLTILCGLLTGIFAGLLGLGGGVICVPAQQLFLKMPLKRAISNSAATIASIALIGAAYKNLTLADHGINITESLRIAAVVIPTAILGSFGGAKSMHKLPHNVVRAAFILLAIAACYKLLTV